MQWQVNTSSVLRSVGLTLQSTGEPTASRGLPVTSNVRPLKLRIASYSKLTRSPFNLGTNAGNAAAIFPQIVAVRTSASRSGYVYVSQLGFKVDSRLSFHQPSCVK